MELTQPEAQVVPGPGRGRRVAAFILSLVAPGAGHFLVGRFRRGAAWVLGLQALLVVAVLTTRVEWIVRGVPVVVALGLLARVAVGLDAVRTGRAGVGWKPVLLGFAALVVADLALLQPVRGWLRSSHLQAFRLPSASMRPGLLAGDFVLVDKRVYRSRTPRRGEIVVFAYPPDERRQMLKRVVALPGEQVQVRGGRVVVDGRPLDEPYVTNPQGAASPSGDCDHAYGCEPTLMPPGMYFLLGDERENSMDSRHWGPVASERISGRVVGIYWSWDGAGSRPRLERVGRLL